MPVVGAGWTGTPTTPARVLEVQGAVGFGGSERHTLQLALGLPSRAGLDVTVVGPYGNNPDMAAALHRAGIAVHDLDLVGPWAVPATVLRLARLVRRLEVDVIHTHLRNADLIGITVGALTRTPVVVTLHGATGPPWPEPVRWRSRAIGWVHRRALRRATRRIIAVSEFTRSSSIEDLGLDAGEVVVVLNGSEPHAVRPAERSTVRASLGIADGAPVVSFIGRTTPDKGIDHFVELARMVGRQLPDSHFLVIGPGGPAPTPAPSSWSSELGGRLHVTGARTDVDRLLAITDVLVVTARQEPFGRTVTEAMAAATPVVAFSTGAMPELVVDGETGFLVPHGDLELLADRVRALLADPGLRRRLGEAGRARWDACFRVERFVDDTARIITS
jgi:glycosyltransferase involved in cell wall biosynthesis